MYTREAELPKGVFSPEEARRIIYLRDYLDIVNRLVPEERPKLTRDQRSHLGMLRFNVGAGKTMGDVGADPKTTTIFNALDEHFPPEPIPGEPYKPIAF